MRAEVQAAPQTDCSSGCASQKQSASSQGAAKVSEGYLAAGIGQALSANAIMGSAGCRQLSTGPRLIRYVIHYQSPRVLVKGFTRLLAWCPGAQALWASIGRASAGCRQLSTGLRLNEYKPSTMLRGCRSLTYLAAGVVSRCTGTFHKRSHRLCGLQTAQHRPAPDEERCCLSASWREAQGSDCTMSPLCLQVVFEQPLHCCKSALGCSCLTQSLQSHNSEPR